MNTPNVPKGHPIELLRYEDDRREIVLTLAQFNELDAVAKDMHGMGLSQLATDDPRAMYRLFKLQLEAVVKHNRLSEVLVDGEPVASERTNTQSELGAKAIEYIRMLPDSDFEEFDLRVSVYPSEMDVELFGADKPIEIIDVPVVPPNLAA